MDFELKNEVVLVTGGAKGIGAAIVCTLAGEATIPVIVDKDVEAANALHSQLPGSEVVIAELSSPESCYAAVDHAIRKFTRLDSSTAARRNTSSRLNAIFCITTTWPTSRCRISRSRGAPSSTSHRKPRLPAKAELLATLLPKARS